MLNPSEGSPRQAGSQAFMHLCQQPVLNAPSGVLDLLPEDVITLGGRLETAHRQVERELKGPGPGLGDTGMCLSRTRPW